MGVIYGSISNEIFDLINEKDLEEILNSEEKIQELFYAE